MGAVSLRDISEADLALFFEHQRDPESAAMAAFASRDAQAHAAHWRKILADQTVEARTVVAGNDTVGNMVSCLHDGHRAIGYWIGKDYWGRGIATKAVAQFVQLVTDRPLLAWVAEDNVGSIRVLEKCGFTPGGEKLASPSEGDGVREIAMELRA